MRNKDRRERFVSLAENRVNKAIKYIRLIGNLSNKGNYEFGENDVRKIFSSLESELRESRKRFKSRERSSNGFFKLD